MPKQKRAAFQLGDSTVQPGESKSIDLEVGTFMTHEKLRLQATVIHGKEPGPTLLISGCIHGDEFNGTEIIRRILRTKSVAKLKGTLLAVPVVNRPGFVRRSRYMPDRRDLNRLFPGSATGSLGARLAKVFTDQLIARSDLVIDLHTGAVNRPNFPQIRITAGDKESMALAKVFDPPVILTASQRESTLRAACIDLKKPVLLYEAGEALRLDAHAIKFGVEGIMSIMRHLGMLSTRSRIRRKKTSTVISKKSYWERSPQGGIFIPLISLGKAVNKDDLLGFIADPQGSAEVEVRASFPGIMIGRTNEAVADEGDGLFHIAHANDVESAEDMINRSTDALPDLVGEENDHPVPYDAASESIS